MEKTLEQKMFTYIKFIKKRGRNMKKIVTILFLMLTM